jgi:glutamate dehydrogenase/leucine dehydrogenase
MHERGVLVIPDFIANAGGVICAATEFQGGTERQAFDSIEQRIRTNSRLVIEESLRTGCLPRAAAVALAERRLRDATQTRRWQ